MLSRIRQFLDHDTFWLELANVSLLFVWAIVLVTPAPTFGTSIAYAVMSFWLPEWGWATLAAVVAAYGCWGLKWHAKHARSIGLLGGVLFWSTVGFSIAASSLFSTGGWVYLALSLLCALAHAFGRRF